MAKTRAQLVAKALNVLGVLGAGESPSAEDYQTIDDSIDAKIAELQRNRVINIGDVDAIEDEFFLPLAEVIAAANAADFVVSTIKGKDPDVVGEMAERKLRRMSTAESTDEILKVDYF